MSETPTPMKEQEDLAFYNYTNELIKQLVPDAMSSAVGRLRAEALRVGLSHGRKWALSLPATAAASLGLDLTK